MPENQAKSKTARTVRASGHKASGGHSLYRREPNTLPEIHHHHKGARMAYEHQEYPKWLHFEGEPSVLVQTYQEEEAAREARNGAPSTAGPDRKALIAKAKAAGVKKANFLTTAELIKLVG